MKKPLVIVLYFIYYFCISFSSLHAADCPIDWYSYDSSCYKSFPAASYRVAMDKCFRLLVKQNYMKRAYLANLESQYEMDYIMYLMMTSKIKGIYIGANNIIKRTNFLSWERLGATMEVDKELLCPDIFIESASFYCGFLRNNLLNNRTINYDYQEYDSSNFTDYNVADFCITTSDCFTNLPYLCEVNCTNQESKCSRWTQEYNANYLKNGLQEPLNNIYKYKPKLKAKYKNTTTSTSTPTISTITTSSTSITSISSSSSSSTLTSTSTLTTTTSTSTSTSSSSSSTSTFTTSTSTSSTSSSSSSSSSTSTLTTSTSSTSTSTSSSTSTLSSSTSTSSSSSTSTKPTTSTSTSSSTTTIENFCLNKKDKCKNNSTCVFNTNVDDKYTCNCIIGYEGTYCQRDERPCQPTKNRCTNNSTCNQFYNTRYYNCTCPTGFEGYHCEVNINDCIEGICQNGGQCEDLINDYKCNCLSFFNGRHCEFKNEELVLKENVSRSFSVLAIIFIVLTFGFFVSLDALRFVFRIEPEGLSKQRQLIKKKKLVKKIIEDMKSKNKRKHYRKYIVKNYRRKDPFIKKLEKTFHLSYDLDLRFIDDDTLYDVSRKSSNHSNPIVQV